MTRKIVLMGLPTSGKSKTAGILAQILHTTWIDTDLEIQQRFGQSIPWIFKELGEQGFRALEYTVVRDALRGSARIVSLGGGAPTYAPTRELLSEHTVYYLKADPDFLVNLQIQRSERSVQKKDAQVRPLLAGDLRERMHELYRQRKDIYENTATVIIDAQSKRSELAGEIIAYEERQGDCIWVSTPGQPYAVSFGQDLNAQVAALMKAHTKKALLLSAPPVAPAANSLAQHLDSLGKQTTVKVLPDGEAAKQLPVLSEVWEAAASAGLERRDAIVALGGGATTDLGGFAAATWLRGINLITVPTTLLAMVDAAIGGKTGIDWSTGKNLVGAFYPPIGVAVDFTTLRTLSPDHLREGLAEALKCGFIRDQQILDIARDNASALLDPDSSSLRDIIRRAVTVKADVVSADLYESGQREYLNYGHTLAHAIERVENYRFPHGLAVSIGMVFAANLAAVLGRGPKNLAARLRDQLEAVGLPTTYSDHAFAELLPIMFSDKKVRGGQLRFVLLEDWGKPVVTPVADSEALTKAAEMTGIAL